ncbi:MAG: SsrA-binding protein SmpB [Candidatus Makana argininalis]
MYNTNEKKKKNNLSIITKNKKVYFKYKIEKEIEGSLSLKGWEVKSIKSGKIDISNSYISINNNEAYLIGSVFQPLSNVSLIKKEDYKRNKKVLLHKFEINKLLFKIKKENCTIIALYLYWKRSIVKIKIGIAKGKKKYEKKNHIKKREWKINQSRIIKIKKKYN